MRSLPTSPERQSTPTLLASHEQLLDKNRTSSSRAIGSLGPQIRTPGKAFGGRFSISSERWLVPLRSRTRALRLTWNFRFFGLRHNLLLIRHGAPPRTAINNDI